MLQKPAPHTLTIATRESPLALWQARHIAAQIRALYPKTEVVLLGMTTRGDQILDQSLSKIGGKGLFVKELESALLDGRADLAVHSMKDMPYTLPDEFRLAAIGPRENPCDALVSNDHASLDALPAGSVVGTSSLRREAQLRAGYPHLQVAPLRGNVQTRLAKLDKGDYAAVILAAAGLSRLDFGQRIRQVLPAELSLPAVGQGALGLEICSGREDLQALLAPLNDPGTAVCVEAERAMSRRLAGNCTVPMAGYCRQEQGRLWLRGLVASVDGRTILRAECVGENPQVLGDMVAQSLLEQGAVALLESLPQ